MKRLILFITALLMVPLAAFAQTVQPLTSPNTPAAPAPAPKYVIVDGKKFFLLQNAHRFTGSNNSPSALSVVHHPRNAAVTRNSAKATPAYNGEDSPKKKDDILSVFPSPPPLSPAPTR
jgi:hypothetical protein